MRTLAASFAFAAVCVLSGVQPHASTGPTSGLQLRAETMRNDPCLVAIVDAEDPPWEPTRDFGGGHGDTSESYGLPQANPGTRLARYAYTVGAHRAGDLTAPDWRTNGRVQLAWAVNYAVGRYGSTCAALWARQRKGWW